MNIDPKLKSFMDRVFKIVKIANPAAYQSLENLVFDIGPSSNPKYGAGPGAMTPLYVGDSYLKGRVFEPGRADISAALDSVFKKNPEMTASRYVYNSRTMKYDQEAVLRKVAGFVGDAVDLISSQLLSPNQASWFQKPFMEPLTWSIFEELVNKQPGANGPWATVMNLPLASYGGGFGMIGNAGAPNNTISDDVNVQTGLMSTQIINLAVTYSLTVEELERSKTESSVPYAGQLISAKQKYANWVLGIITAALGYYGNTPTDTEGLLTVNGATAFTGTTLAAIIAGSSTHKGQLAYEQLATLVNDFLTGSQNKFTKVDITMSPYALNWYNSLNYSETYNPETPAQIFEKNFNAGLGKGKQKVTFNFRSDPLLNSSAVNPFNPLAHDYLILSSPEISTGVDDEVQPLLPFGMPLENFVFPVTPGQYGQQFKTLRRVAGIICPYTPAIKSYYGFGA